VTSGVNRGPTCSARQRREPHRGTRGAGEITEQSHTLALLDDGAWAAFDNACTHEECPLSEGTLTDNQVECYCHGAVFNMRTGEALVGPAVASIETYPVREEGGEIQVELPG